MSDTPHVVEPATFPKWARVVLGLLVAAVTYLVAGDVIRIGESERALITSLVLLLASVGIVPPSPGDIKISPTINIILTVVVIVIGYVVNVYADLEPVLRGILLAVAALIASLGIVPPQARPVHG